MVVSRTLYRTLYIKFLVGCMFVCPSAGLGPTYKVMSGFIWNFDKSLEPWSNERVYMKLWPESRAMEILHARTKEVIWTYDLLARTKEQSINFGVAFIWFCIWTMYGQKNFIWGCDLFGLVMPHFFIIYITSSSLQVWLLSHRKSLKVLPSNSPLVVTVSL